MRRSATIVLLALFLQIAAGEVSRALLALDRTVVGALVAGRNASVQYIVHNVGNSAATSVYLKDLSFPNSRFTIYSGSFKHRWETLLPNNSMSLSVDIMPKKAGHLIVSPASVTYMDGETQRTTKLAADDEILVEDLVAYRRRTDKHQREWIAYLGAFVLLAVMPFVVSASIEGGVPKDNLGKKKL